MRKEIDEAIADALAEEQVAKAFEQAEAKGKEEQRNREFFKSLMRGESLADKREVTITLSEYVELKDKERDLDLILKAIIEGMGLSYNNEYIYLKNEGEVTNVFRILYPDVYESLYDEALEEDK